MGTDKRILIVDDEDKVAFFLRESLEELGRDFVVEAAGSGEEALEMLAAQHFDLIISDLRMPGIDGLELLERVKEQNPDTRLILMTAYGSDDVEAEARRLEIYQYITKPFHISDLVEAARDALADVAVSQEGMLVLADEQFEEINKCLANLRFEVGSQCLLLADLAGQVVSEVGITEGLDTGTFIPLIADGFATTFKLAQYLQDRKAFNLNFYEGKSYDIYSTSVGDNLFLTLVFDRRKQPSRIGMVWLYAKRTIQDLLGILGPARVAAESQVEAEEEIAQPEMAEEKPEDLEKETRRREVIESAMTKLAESGEELEITEDLESDTITFNIEEALKKGLIDEDFAQLLLGEE
jgi:CheY-like chemotaxis protein